MRFASLSLLALLACDGKGESGTTPTGDDSTTGTPTGNPNSGSATDPLRSATLSGTVNTCAGTGLEGAQIRFCDDEFCRNQQSAADGSYSYPDSKYGWNSFEVIGPAGQDLATSFAPIQLADGEVRTVDVTLCPHDPFTALTGSATEVEHGEGLYITVSTSLIEKPTPFDDDPTETAGLKVDTAHYMPTDGITGASAAQWFLEPFNYKASATTGLDYRVDGGTIGLTATTYHVWVGSYDDFAWLDAGTISDGDADGWYTPDADGLPLLGTVVLVEE